MTIVYHYTTAKRAAGIQKVGLWAQSSATTSPRLTAREAVTLLGLRTVPDVVVAFRNGREFVPNKPMEVRPHALGVGGGVDLTNPRRVPPECIVSIDPVKR